MRGFDVVLGKSLWKSYRKRSGAKSWVCHDSLIGAKKLCAVASRWEV
jgi:hypothetical protein